MNHYLGVRICTAEPCEKNNIPGYTVYFTNGHQGWYPKDIFESCYFKLNDPDGRAIIETDIEDFIKQVDTNQIGSDTMLTHAITKNHYDVYTVSPGTIESKALAHQIGLSQVKARIFRALSFMLKWGRSGLIW